MRSSSLVAPILTTLALLSSLARAAGPDEARASSQAPIAEPNEGLALMTGAAAAIIPITLGAALMSSGKTSAEKNLGFAIAGAGFGLAPIVSHAVLGEFRRAALFGALPALSEIGMVAVMASREDAVFHGSTLSRTTFGVLFCVDVVFSMIGLIDAAMAGDRARGKGFILAPSIAHDRIGLTASGAL
jgi:hypothetical protein